MGPRLGARTRRDKKQGIRPLHGQPHGHKVHPIVKTIFDSFDPEANHSSLPQRVRKRGNRRFRVFAPRLAVPGINQHSARPDSPPPKIKGPPRNLLPGPATAAGPILCEQRIFPTSPFPRTGAPCGRESKPRTRPRPSPRPPSRPCFHWKVSYGPSATVYWPYWVAPTPRHAPTAPRT